MNLGKLKDNLIYIFKETINLFYVNKVHTIVFWLVIVGILFVQFTISDTAGSLLKIGALAYFALNTTGIARGLEDILDNITKKDTEIFAFIVVILEISFGFLMSAKYFDEIFADVLSVMTLAIIFSQYLRYLNNVEYIEYEKDLKIDAINNTKKSVFSVKEVPLDEMDNFSDVIDDVTSIINSNKKSAETLDKELMKEKKASKDPKHIEFDLDDELVFKYDEVPKNKPKKKEVKDPVKDKVAARIALIKSAYDENVDVEFEVISTSVIDFSLTIKEFEELDFLIDDDIDIEIEKEQKIYEKMSQEKEEDGFDTSSLKETSELLKEIAHEKVIVEEDVEEENVESEFLDKNYQSETQDDSFFDDLLEMGSNSDDDVEEEETASLLNEENVD